MGIKKDFPLAQVKELLQEQKEQLRNQGITTAEEFVRHARGVPSEFAEFLGVSEEELRFLTEAISKYIDPKILDRILMLREAMPNYGMGALGPGLFDSTVCPSCIGKTRTGDLKACKECGKIDFLSIDTVMYCRKCAKKLGVCRGCGIRLRNPQVSEF